LDASLEKNPSSYTAKPPSHFLMSSYRSKEDMFLQFVRDCRQI